VEGHSQALQRRVGHQAQGVIAELLARPEVELVHLRNVGYGCYNFAVRAVGADGDERTARRERGS